MVGLAQFTIYEILTCFSSYATGLANASGMSELQHNDFN
jgi:hypothetical protein